MQNWLFDIRSRTFVILVVIFLLITAIVYSGVTESFDQGVVLFFSEDVVGDPVLDTVMQVITEAGDGVTMLAVGIFVLLIPKTRRIGITLMILIVLSTLLTGYIKCGIDRDRPDFEYEGIPFPISVSQDTFALFCDGGFNASYPSGHAARSMLFAVIFGYAISDRFPRGAYLVMLYPALVSVSRLYVLQHYPMDVIGGTVIGVLLAGVIAKRTKLYKIFDRSKT